VIQQIISKTFRQIISLENPYYITYKLASNVAECVKLLKISPTIP